MWEIIENLYLGDELDARDREVLEEYGITHILNCAYNAPCFFPRYFQYLHLELHDPDPAFIEYIPEICVFIDSGLRTGSVLVHCRQGLHRSPSAILAYLCHVGLTLDQGIEVLKKGVEEDDDFIEPPEVFLDQIIEYFEQIEAQD